MKYIICDEDSPISEKVWKKLKKIKIPSKKGKIIVCGVDYAENKAMAIFGYWDKKGVFHVKKQVQIDDN